MQRTAYYRMVVLWARLTLRILTVFQRVFDMRESCVLTVLVHEVELVVHVCVCETVVVVEVEVFKHRGRDYGW